MDIVQDTNGSELPSVYRPRAATVAADLVDQVSREGYVPITLDLVTDALVAAYEAGRNHVATAKEIAQEAEAKQQKQAEAFANKVNKRRG